MRARLDDSIRIVEVDENQALYREAHIPGAIGFDWQNDLQDQVKRDFLGPEAFGELLGSRGVSNDHLVILYCDRNNWFVAYTRANRVSVVARRRSGRRAAAPAGRTSRRGSGRSRPR